MASPILERIYSIQLQGFDDSLKKVNQLTEAWEKADTAKRKLNESLQMAAASGDTATVSKLNGEINALEAQIAKLTQTKATASKETAILAQAEAAASKAAAEYLATTKAVAPALSAANVSVETYTGSIQENIRAQLANQQSIDLNKIAQKSVTDEMKKAGTATNEQVSKLAKLKEEAVLLSQSNKDLTTTIRNQAKEFLSSNGSIDEGRNKLNLLQKAYGQLSEAERNSSFGTELKKEIDALEPAVKKLEQSIGLFQRNVGNYPTNFTPALKVLGTELANIQAKIVQLPVGSKAFDELAGKAATLSSITESLNGNFKSAQAEANAYKTAATTLGTTFGTNSEVFAEFTDKVKEGNSAVEESKEAVEANTEAGKKSTGVVSGLFSGIRKLADVIPGLGISGLFLLLLTPLESLATAIIDLFNKFDAAKDKVKALNEVTVQASAAISEQKAGVLALTAVIKDNSLSLDTRKEALNQLIAISPEYLRGLTLENIATKEGKVLLDAYIGSLRKRAELDAALSVNANRNQEVSRLTALKQELADLRTLGKTTFDDLGEDLQAFVDNSTSAGRTKLTTSLFNLSISDADLNQVGVNIDKAIQKASLRAGSSLSVYKDKFKQSLTADGPDSVKGIIQDLQDKIANLQAIQPTLINEAAIKSNVAEIKKLQDELDRLLGKTDKPKTPSASKLSAADTDALRDADARRNDLLAKEKIKFLLLQENEETYLRNVLKINTNAANEKIKLIDGSNAAERVKISELKLYKLEQEQDTQKKIFEIRAKGLEDERKETERDLLNQLAETKDNPNSTAVQKLRAQELYYAASSVNQTLYNQAMDKLEKEYGLQSKDNEQKRASDIDEIRRNLNKTSLDLAKAGYDEQLQLIRDRGVRENQLLTEQNAQKIIAIYADNSTTKAQKFKQLADLERQNRLAVLDAELLDLNNQLIKKSELYGRDIQITKEVDALNAEIAKKTAERVKAGVDVLEEQTKKVTSIGDRIRLAFNKLFKIDDDSEASKLFGETLSKAYDFATSTMNAYYDARRERIEEDKRISYERIDIEKEQLLAQAQSSAERETIERQAAAKKKDADKAALEENKKIQRAQAAINLAIQLSNLAVIASAPGPLNILTLGVAGAISYGVQAGLALATYALNLSRINSAKYAGGGYTGPGAERDETGHRVAGVVHEREWVAPKWMAEHPEYGRVIRKMEKVRQRGYADGGYASIDGLLGGLGDSLQAPYNPSSFLLSGQSGGSTDLTMLAGMIADTQRQVLETSRQVRNIKVQVVAQEVEQTNDDIKKANSIGTL